MEKRKVRGERAGRVEEGKRGEREERRGEGMKERQDEQSKRGDAKRERSGEQFEVHSRYQWVLRVPQSVLPIV